MAFACMSGGCLFQAPVDFEPAAAMRAIVDRLALATEHLAAITRAREHSHRLPALPRPTVDIGLSQLSGPTPRQEGLDSIANYSCQPKH